MLSAVVSAVCDVTTGPACDVVEQRYSLRGHMSGYAILRWCFNSWKSYGGRGPAPILRWGLSTPSQKLHPRARGQNHPHSRRADQQSPSTISHSLQIV